MKAIIFLLVIAAVPAFAEDRNLASTSHQMSSWGGYAPQVTPNDPFCPACLLQKYGFFGDLTDQTNVLPKFDSNGNNTNDLNQ